MLTPLVFAPVFRQYLWGGRRLGQVLGKPIGSGDRYAESWEVVDHGPDQSVVEAGYIEGRSLAGRSLRDLMENYGPLVVGPKIQERIEAAAQPTNLRGRFPLLVKWLDAQQNLSLQVHPNSQQAALLSPPDLGKSEAWYVADAVPGARVYAGLLPGVGRSDCEKALQSGRVSEILHSFCPNVGDCIYIPAGTVHAIGAGLLVAEVQQASDTTYRLYDWERMDENGRPRALQIEQALAVADWERGPVHAAQPVPIPPNQLPGRVDGTLLAETLVDCEYFRLDRGDLRGELSWADGCCRILISLQGAAKLHAEGCNPLPLAMGSSVLIPHAAKNVSLECLSPFRFLVASLP